ncbi:MULTISPECIES: 16S rRNA pseudouridylate synthase [Microbacterium]|uniref:aggregation-promoting factor C-terminal-like domain-containing protein n=1 Tax=Microbacterium TaxID=33882 RepID=UPI0009C13FAD|nr:16S rRNA pseudouridylate synthase [Microbacterium testaceum]
MSSDSTPTHNRRARRLAARRSTRRPAITAGVVALGLAATVTLTGTAPLAQANAGSSLLSASSMQLASYSAPVAPGTTSDPDRADARAAEQTAAASLQAATTVQNDIAASGLDIGQPATVDTTALQAAADHLTAAQVLPSTFLPGVTGDVKTEATAVDQRVSALRGSLDAAIAKKQEEEAAEKARQEAEAAAAAQAKADAEAAANTSSGSSSGGGDWTPAPSSGGGSGDNSPAGAQATARGMLSGYGWGDDQFSCLVSLWNRESGWNYQAYNAGSGAYGIPQALPGSKMSSAGADWQTNAGTQIAWGLGYISGRYGSPCGAWDHSQSTGWY